MYTIEDLNKFDYFQNVDINYALDSLTGVLSRGYILGFTKHLISKNVPFAMGIIDVDNFKLVNDNYGHDFGDKCLADVASNLANYFKDNGVVGRYGGDEFIFLYFGDTSYDNIHKVISDMYTSGKVVRKKFKYQNVENWITSTAGCASFPKDAKNYTDLFANVDKTLYRGKTKGRNCYIVYVEEKHKNIDVHKKEFLSIASVYNSLNRIFEDRSNLQPDEVVKNSLDYLINILNFSQAVFIKNDGTIITNVSSISEAINQSNFDFIKDSLVDEEIFIPSNVASLRVEDINYRNLFEKFNFLTFIAAKMDYKNTLYGYLILFESKIERVWQEKDIATVMYLSKLIELLYK